MTARRLLTQIRFWMFLGNGRKRAEYARRKEIFAQVGENCKIPMAVPLYPKLVKIHNNVSMHRSVKLSTHDYVNSFLMKIPNSFQYKHLECLTPIEIFDNVYIGMNSIILGNVHIGPNAIISAGSVVTNDIPPNSVVAGVPAKVVGSFDMFQKSRILMDKTMSYEFRRSGKEAISQKAVKMAWAQFDSKRAQEKHK